MGKKTSGKEERRAHKADANRSREKGRRRGGALDRMQLATFAGTLRANGFTLKEVDRDGNCFLRSLADQLEEQQHNYDGYRQKVMSYMEAHPDDYCPFLTFGEGDEEDDKDFEEYTARMRRDGEWAGQPELLAAAKALGVEIVVHQFEMPSYRISCEQPSVRCIHVSYHDGEHYNSVHALETRGGTSSKAGGRVEAPDTREGKLGARERWVMERSGCIDLQAVRVALRESEDDSARAIEALVERLGEMEVAAQPVGGGSHSTEAEGGGAGGGAGTGAGEDEAKVRATPRHLVAAAAAAVEPCVRGWSTRRQRQWPSGILPPTR